jgi:hypothetical protein
VSVVKTVVGALLEALVLFLEFLDALFVVAVDDDGGGGGGGGGGDESVVLTLLLSS